MCAHYFSCALAALVLSWRRKAVDAVVAHTIIEREGGLLMEEAACTM